MTLVALPLSRPREIHVFVCNGATYEEARFVDYLNRLYPSCRIVLGTNFVHNSRRYPQRARATVTCN